MAGANSTDRFEYLFDPIDDEGDGAVDGALATAAATTEPEPSNPRGRLPLLLIAAAILLGAIVGMIVLWQRPVDTVEPSTGATTQVPPRPVVTGSPAAVPTVEASAAPQPQPTSDAPTTVVAATIAIEPPVQPRASSASPTARAPTPTPIVRSPMSVSPQPRPAFPHQRAGGGNDNGHPGLLGGLGGIL